MVFYYVSDEFFLDSYLVIGIGGFVGTATAPRRCLLKLIIEKSNQSIEEEKVSNAYIMR